MRRLLATIHDCHAYVMMACLCLIAISAPAHAQPPPPASPPDAGDTDTSPDTVSAHVAEARSAWQAGRLTDALPLLEDIARAHLDHPLAEPSVQMLLDTLNQLQRYNDMERWVEHLLAPENQAFVHAHPSLADTLHTLQRQLLRRHAEDWLRQGDHGACARAYLELYKRYPRAPDADETLYNAAVCAQVDGSHGVAIATLKSLLHEFPRSRLAVRAHVRLAGTYDQLAMYDQAATWHETLARRYPGERDAVDALQRAIVLRHALGQGAHARRLIELFDKLYGKRHADRRAGLYLLALETFQPGEEAAAMGLLERQLKNWGRGAGPMWRVIAHARLGELLWRSSCKRAGRDLGRDLGDDPAGSCVVFVTPAKDQPKDQPKGQDKGQPVTCRPAAQVRVMPRDRARADKARKHLELAVKDYAASLQNQTQNQTQNRNGLPPGDMDYLRAAADVAYAKARFYLAERDYESYLAIASPSELDFEPENPTRARESTRRLQSWMVDKRRRADALSRDYQAILSKRASAGPWAGAVATRMAQIALDMSQGLVRVEIPASIRRGRLAADKTQAYCRALEDVAQPMEDRALDGFRYCVTHVPTGIEPWREVCMRALESLRPAEHPPMREHHGAADHVGAIIERGAPILTRPKLPAEP